MSTCMRCTVLAPFLWLCLLRVLRLRSPFSAYYVSAEFLRRMPGNMDYNVCKRQDSMHIETGTFVHVPTPVT